MKKTILIYHLIVFAISIIINFYYIYESPIIRSHYIISPVICMIGIYLTYQAMSKNKKGNALAIKFLLGFNLIQVFPFSLSGLTMKIVYGPTILIFFRRIGLNGDLLQITEFIPFLNDFYVFYEPNLKVFYVGINIIHFLFCIYFFNLIKKERS